MSKTSWGCTWRWLATLPHSKKMDGAAHRGHDSCRHMDEQPV